MSTKISKRKLTTNEKKQRIVDKLIIAMEKGISWKSGLPKTAAMFTATSGSTNKLYRGVNQLILSFQAQGEGYTNNIWYTFNQVKKLGGAYLKSWISVLKNEPNMIFKAASLAFKAFDYIIK